jgi:hypothetical protein
MHEVWCEVFGTLKADYKEEDYLFISELRGCKNNDDLDSTFEKFQKIRERIKKGFSARRIS